MTDRTIKFDIVKDRDSEIKNIIAEVYNALSEGGYNAVNQLVGYILSEDPTYITTHKNARTLIRSVDRDELLQALIRDYVKNRQGM